MDKKRIILAGGGGFGLELWNYLRQDIQTGRFSNNITLGVLDATSECEVVAKEQGVDYLGTIEEFSPTSDDEILIAIGNVRARLAISRMIKDRGGNLMTYVHNSVLISTNSTICEGSIICPNSVVNAGAHVGLNSVINVFCSVGHGARIGANSILSPFCALSGDSVLGERCFLGTRATLFPKVRLGNDCIVDAHTAVRRSEGDANVISSRGQYRVERNQFSLN